MRHLSELQWKAFDLTELFSIGSGVRLVKKDMKIGLRPFIGATDSNNGITEFVSNNNQSLDKNVLGVNYNGSVVECFYHPYFAIFTDDVKRLHLLDYPDSKYVLLFMKSVILKQKVKFQYGYKFNAERMRRQKIMLPVDEKGKPDYKYMEEYMISVEKNLLHRYKAYLSQVFDPDNYTELNKQKKWKAFLLNQVFNINSTKSSIDRRKLNGLTGDIPYITRTDKNNAWDSFIGIQNDYDKDEGNVITIGLDTQTAFYQPIHFYTGQNIQVLSHEKMNKYVALFITPLLKQLMNKFNWGGNGATLSRLRREKIMLPVDENGEPDFKYMESFMRNIEAEKLQAYISMRLRC